jgi:hypothetical protein
MRKKIKFLLLILVAAALLVSAPVANLPLQVYAATSNEPHKYTAIGQNPAVFTRQQVSTNDIADWTASIGGSGVAQTMNTADFEKTVTDKKLTQNPYMKYSPNWADKGDRTVAFMTQSTKYNTSGSYSSESISLPANGNYVISVEYYVVGSQPTYFNLSAGSAQNPYKIPLGQQYIAKADPAKEYEYSYKEYTYKYTEYAYAYTEYTYEYDDNGTANTVTVIKQFTEQEIVDNGYDLIDTVSGLTKITTKAIPNATDEGYSSPVTKNKTEVRTYEIPKAELDEIVYELSSTVNKTRAENKQINEYTYKKPDGTEEETAAEYTGIELSAGGIAEGYILLSKPADFTLKKETDLRTLKSNWQTAYFFVQTDLLETANITATVTANLGDSNTFMGAVYLDSFQIWAMSPNEFDKVYDGAKFKFGEKINLTNKQIEREHSGAYPKTFTVGDFQSIPAVGNAQSILAIPNAAVPSTLNFADTTKHFHTEDGTAHDVMLVAANNSFAGITTKKDSNFKPKPHEVYMIQFYVTGASMTYYFRIGDDYQSITAGAYPYHNGWQLCTYFVTGDAINSAGADGLVLGFYVGRDNSPTTGWMAVDGVWITRVSGSYASGNASASGASSVNLNQREDSASPANAYFDRGTAGNIYLANGEFNTGYPYPLTAESWTADNSSNNVKNGIMNTLNGDYAFGDIPNPSQISGKSADNNVYMLRNIAAVNNSISSPAFTTTANAKTYISFDAQVRDTNQNKTSTARAVINYTNSADDGSITKIKLGEIEITESVGWQNYEFAINEGEFTLSRSCILTFEIDGANSALFFDNVRIATTKHNSQQTQIDLTNPLKISGMFTVETGKLGQNRPDGKEGIALWNEQQVLTTAADRLTYSVNAGEYYKLTVTARGENASLYISGYDGNIAVIKNDEKPSTDFTEYSLFFLADEKATEIMLKIDIGLADTLDDDGNFVEANYGDGNIYIQKLEFVKIEEGDYNTAQTAVEEGDTTIAVVTVQATEEEEEETVTPDNFVEDSNFFGQNWWYLIPTLITAIAIVVAVAGYLFRKLKFNKHITRKGTSYARDIKIEKARKNIKAVKVAKENQKQKVDNDTNFIDNSIDDETDAK